jgi:tetratricopeptide (TPR) repeat protein
MMMGNVEEALRAYDEALRIDSACVPALISKALLFELTNQLDEARQVLARALQLEPDNAANQLAMAILERRIGEFDAALQRLRDLDAARLPHASLTSEYHFETARVLDRLGQADAAFAEFIAANRLHAEARHSRNTDKNRYRAIVDDCLRVVSEDWVDSWQAVA